MRRVFGITLLVCLGSSVASAEEGMEALLSKNCLECHDDLTKKGDLSLESLDLAVTGANAGDWERCLIQLERGFMPPASESQPTAGERERAIRDLENRLVAYHGARPDERPQAVLRRLNAVEYGNTIRDLLKLEAYKDLAKDFPGDERSHGFASNGQTLVTSNFLLRQYLEAAELAVARAVHFEAKPEVRRWDMKPPFDRTTGQEQGQAAAYYQKIGEPQPYQDICQR
ncbi:MAG: DUF1587 domain-containing protein, partial [Verrucomicrobiae bacterium]|nr:DUF1587 domain-containing protein [Verrucomicrobiae bacterium]